MIYIYITQHYDSNVLDTEGKCSIAMALVLGLKFINTRKKVTNSSVDFILIYHDAHLFEHFACLFEHFACLFGTIYCSKMNRWCRPKIWKTGTHREKLSTTHLKICSCFPPHPFHSCQYLR